MAAQTPHLDPDLLSAYLDEEVSPAERARVESHLAACASCQQELAALRKTVALLRQLPPVPLPRTFYLTEEMVEPAPRGRLIPWPSWLPALTTMAALLLCALLVRGTIPAPVPSAGTSEIAVAPAAEAEMAAPAEEPESADTMRMAEESATVLTEESEGVEAPAGPEPAPPSVTQGDLYSTETVSPTVQTEMIVVSPTLSPPPTTAPSTKAGATGSWWPFLLLALLLILGGGFILWQTRKINE